MRKVIAIVLFFVFIQEVYSQIKPAPRLVVGVVVDQMKYEYLVRYYNKFSENGFKKLLSQGYSFNNTHYNYMPTYTAPGHASIYTGTTPSAHGIIANSWYDKKNAKTLYSVEDKKYKTVGENSYSGEMSPGKMFCSTFGDCVKKINSKSKVIGVSLKDRGAILPVGFSANAAYWFSGNTGNFITSNYYMKELPKWVQEFNAKAFPKKYCSENWNTLYPPESYTESMADDNLFEELFVGESSPVFPHKIPELMNKNGGYTILKSTPSGNTLVKDFAIAAIENEQLGIDEITDFLSISFSSTDYIGHMYGPRSVEVEDCFLRLDADIAILLNYLDEKVGKENYLLFLTSDHGVGDNPAYLQANKMPGGFFSSEKVYKKMYTFLKENYADSLLLSFSNYQVFLNNKSIERNKIDKELLLKSLQMFLKTMQGIAEVYRYEDVKNANDGIALKVKNGINTSLSGDLYVVVKEGWMDNPETGTTHFSPYTYDTHVPWLMYGANVIHGSSNKEVRIIDIISTVCNLCFIPEPPCSSGKPQELK